MLTKRYLASTRNIPEILNQIIKGTAPDIFNIDHLKAIGFTSSNDRAVIPLLKDLGFLSATGVPTQRYHDYRSGGQKAKAVLGQALLDAYEELFHINANPTEKDRQSIIGRFKSAHNVGDRPAEQMAATFLSLLKLADLDAARKGGPSRTENDQSKEPANPKDEDKVASVGMASLHPTGAAALALRYNIEVHLPATKDVEVYGAIFKALKEHFYD